MLIVDLHFVVVVVVPLSSFVNDFHFVDVLSSFDFQAAQTHESLHQLLSSTPNYFWLPFLFHLPWALQFWVDIFYPRVFFYLTLLPDILVQPAFIKVSLGACSYFLESCRASYWSLKQRRGPSVCLIHSNPQSSIHLKSVFMHVNIAKSFTCGENFDKISSHENIKQQPN